MSNIERISNKIADKIAIEIKVNDEKKEVIAYGIFGIIQTLLSILLVIIFGIIFNVLIEALIVSFTTSILRKYSGGVHASSPNICMMIGTFNCTVIPIIIKNLRLTWTLVSLIGIMIFILSYIIIIRLAPVDSANKPIKNDKKRKILKKKSIINLTIYLFIVFMLLIFYNILFNKNLLLYCVCIYAGILWQVFTLTNIGDIVLRSVDSFFNKFIK
ncbi:accessory gene regulator ArgB-like protein [Eubacterium multiforme]|uniref:Accessory gene regulator B n=1 Tax=Eubacterium multiforme TaxID=83339 RepID=A0ABT9URH5_9FIRM|nr:accessory gene regulator B family protein [Eubacterium multiforme]MDQ0148234.1 accessory gene regulator B [Eubacterium multiforme]